MQKSILLSIFTILFCSFVAVAQPDAANEELRRNPLSLVTDKPIPQTSDERLTIETKDKDGQANKGLKLEKEIKPRLPNGFTPVVDAAQKEKIYKIQTDYNVLIAMLELRIELLKKERNAKIDAVLTPAQLQKINRPARGGLLQRQD